MAHLGIEPLELAIPDAPVVRLCVAQLRVLLKETLRNKVLLAVSAAADLHLHAVQHDDAAPAADKGVVGTVLGEAEKAAKIGSRDLQAMVTKHVAHWLHIQLTERGQHAVKVRHRRVFVRHAVNDVAQMHHERYLGALVDQVNRALELVHRIGVVPLAVFTYTRRLIGVLDVGENRKDGPRLGGHFT